MVFSHHLVQTVEHFLKQDFHGDHRMVVGEEGENLYKWKTCGV